MSKLASPKKAAAKPAGKLAGSGAKAAAKPGKALAKPAKTKEAPVNFKVGEVVEFVAYQNREEGAEPLFEEGDRVVLLEKKKDNDNGTVFFTAVKEEDAEAFKADPDSVNGDEVYPSEIKKAEKPAVDPYALTLVENDHLNELVAEHGDPLTAAKALQEEAERATFYLGGALALLWQGRKYLEYGEEEYADPTDDAGKSISGVAPGSGWDKFCQENFNEGGRKCFELIGTYAAFSGLLTADKIEEIASNKKIGWVKLAYVKSIVNKDNVDEIIELAKDSSVAEFKETIKADYVSDAGAEARSGGGAKVKRTVVKVAFFEDQAASVDYVLKQAAKDFGIDLDTGLNQIFERIILDWAAQNLGEPVLKKARQAKRAKLKELKTAGVDVAARTKEDADVEEFLSRNEGEE